MQVRFWGTRGSIAKAGPATVRYGGNTSCVEVRSASGAVLVFDCGTGAHGLGQALVRDPPAARRGHLFISHTHWDHIQGLPFFAPLFQPGNEWHVYGPQGLGRSLRDVLAGQMEYTYFPITPAEFSADLAYHDLVEGSFEVDDIRVTTQYLNHPALTLAYRIEADGVTLVYATDHEPHLARLADGGAPPPGGEDEKHGSFLADADLVIHDTQYTAEEYPRFRGWGHSTLEYVVDLARAGSVRRLAMFHHDPNRHDDALDQLVARARARARHDPIDLLAAAVEGSMSSDAGVTDWLATPCSEIYARTRIRAWCLRRACRWRSPPPSPDEPARQQALDRLGLTPTPEDRFDRHTRIAAALFDVPIVLINIISDDCQWSKASHGCPLPSPVPRDMSFCARAILGPDVLEISDVWNHAFGDNPLARGDLQVRFYAGIPIAAPDGHRVGTLCIIDDHPRRLDERERDLLRDLGHIVERELSAPAPA